MTVLLMARSFRSDLEVQGLEVRLYVQVYL